MPDISTIADFTTFTAATNDVIAAAGHFNTPWGDGKTWIDQMLDVLADLENHYASTSEPGDKPEGKIFADTTNDPAQLKFYKDGAGNLYTIASLEAANAFTGVNSFAGITNFPDGSAAAPSITNTGDNDTGIFFPSANGIGFAALGVEPMRITVPTDLTDAVIAILSTEESTSPTTGALTVGDGVGIAGALWVGGLANVAGAMTMQAAATVGGTLGVTGAATFSATGDGMDYSPSNSGGKNRFLLRNTSNTASSDTTLFVGTAGSSGGDPVVQFNVATVTSWTVGIDNSDGDSFKIEAGASLSATPDLKITTAGVVSIPATTASTSSTTGALVVSGGVGIAKSTHIASADALAVPVLTLIQNDVSEEFIEFVCTMGEGNGIEEIGVKSLTTTHFIKIVLDGSPDLVRYIPVGTIA